jgi:hypothetical protein
MGGEKKMTYCTLLERKRKKKNENRRNGGMSTLN